MTIIKDPEGNETRALHEMIDFKGCSVLEIGSGDGRLTWRYAGKAAHTTGIDPSAEAIDKARLNTPAELRGRVSFLEASLQDFTASFKGPKFDLAVFAWSL